MKKWVLLLGLLSPISFVYAQSSAPIDSEEHIFQHLADTGIMQYGDPYRGATRAEGLAVSLRAGGIVIPEFTGNENVPFTDTDPNAWYAPIIARGIETGIVSEKNSLFRPEEAISKAEFLAFLFRATNVNFRPYASRLKNIASDISEDDWFASCFAYAKQFQIAYLGSDNLYHPYETLTRKRMAIMTFRQLRLFYGNNTTKTFIELQALLDRFLTLLRSENPDEAEMLLQRILELNEKLMLTENNQEAVAASAISQSLKHFSESLRAFKFGNNLSALENLHLSAKQAQRALEKSEKLEPFAMDLSTLIDETLTSFLHPQYIRLSQQ